MSCVSVMCGYSGCSHLIRDDRTKMQQLVLDEAIATPDSSQDFYEELDEPFEDLDVVKNVAERQNHAKTPNEMNRSLDLNDLENPDPVDEKSRLLG